MQFTPLSLRRRIASHLPAVLPGMLPPAASAPKSPEPPSSEDILRIQDDREFLEAAYQRILGRPCDISGLASHLEALRRHVPRRVVLRRLSESKEARSRSTDPDRPSRASAGRARKWSLKQAWQSLNTRVRQVAGNVLLARFDSLDHKLLFLMEELSSRTERLSEKLDRAYGHGETLESQIKVLDSRTQGLESIYLDLRAAGLTGDKSTAASLAKIERRLHPPVLLSGNGVLATEVDGFIIGVPAAEWRVAAHLAFRGALEPGVTKLFQTLVKPGMVVVDVGANIGIYTLHAARLLAGRGKVHSFEPTPETVLILRDNIQVNGFLESGLVDIHPIALSDSGGEARLTVFPDNSGHNTLFWSDAAAGISVKTAPLDEVLGPTARVDLVKIDTEGAEPLVLRGMRQIIAANPQIQIILEFAPSHLERAGVKPEDLLTDIRALGLRIYRIDDMTGDLAEVPESGPGPVFSANLYLTKATPGDIA